jgi:hypothetical protein
MREEPAFIALSVGLIGLSHSVCIRGQGLRRTDASLAVFKDIRASCPKQGLNDPNISERFS